jgi:DNA-binding MarR family transcriptional regulator
MSDALHLPLLETTADETRVRRKRIGDWQRAAYAAAKRGDISDFDYRVVVALTNYPSAIRGICWPGIGVLADQLGRCDRAVRNSIKRLSNAGFVSVRRRGHRSNVYTFMYEGRELFENVIPFNQKEKARVNRNPRADLNRNPFADLNRNHRADESVKRESYKESLSNHHHPGTAGDNVVRLSDQRTSGDEINQEAAALADRIAVIGGIDPAHPPPSWRGAEVHVAKWLRQGWDPETILLAVGSTMATRGISPQSVRYFERPIARLVAQLRAPLPKAEAVAAPISRPNLDRQTEPVPEPPLPPDSTGGRWQAVKRRLAELHGDDVVKAWFARVSINRVENSSLVLMAPTKFIGDWISQHWADRIVAAWLEIGGDKAIKEICIELSTKKNRVLSSDNQPQNNFEDVQSLSLGIHRDSR